MTPKRHFPDWISAYCDYARDAFCPERFHLWTGLSVLSGAVERKIWIVDEMVRYYPNIFVLLVAHPGVGKSTAINRGTDLLEHIKLHVNPDFKIISDQISQAGLMAEMKTFRMINFNGKDVPMTSCYYHASEASNSGLTDFAGDFNATITALYDCTKTYRKRLKQEVYSFPNPSFSMISGSTFEFLRNVINQNSVMGGLASRFNYVIEKDAKKEASTWSGRARPKDEETRKKLIEDLVSIHNVQGTFRTEVRAAELYDEWATAQKEKESKVSSERMLSLMVRIPTTLRKLVMLCSISERNDLSITREHMERAIQMTDDVTKDNALIISSAIIANKNTQDSINQFIMQTTKRMGNCAGILMADLRSKFITFGGDLSKFDGTIEMLTNANMVKMDTSNGAPRLQLLVDPDLYL